MTTPRHRAIIVGALLATCGVAAAVRAQSLGSIELVVDAPAELESVASHVRNFDTTRLAGVMRLTGIQDTERPIRMVLMPEQSATARDTPVWVAGFADSAHDLVVLFPSRIGSYPYGTLEGVVYHEVAHVLINRAANGRRVPRWFNEGLASAAEQTWGLEDRSRFTWELLVRRTLTVTQLETLFGQGRRDAARAYVLSEALVRDILQRHGSRTAARLLRRMGDGTSFEAALYATTGLTISEHLRLFWDRHAVWKRWIALAGRPFTLWSFATFLALVAIWRHRHRRFERRQRWEMEERAEDQAWDEHRGTS